MATQPTGHPQRLELIFHAQGRVWAPCMQCGTTRTPKPNTPQIFATGSDNYIQWHEPDLVANATALILARIAR